jgi:hypothetical protein
MYHFKKKYFFILFLHYCPQVSAPEHHFSPVPLNKKYATPATPPKINLKTLEFVPKR